MHLAKTLGTAFAVVCISFSACERDTSGNVQPAPETRAAGERAGNAAHDLGHAAVRGAEAAGHGAVCGVRELGQSLSGTQGDPVAEAQSRPECDKAQQRGEQAGQSMDRMTHEIAPSARGGGPQR